MSTQHASLTGADLHEPKGASSASSGQVYIADGLGSGVWTTVDSSLVLSSAPASASDTGTAGQIAYDADYFYICVATDTWKRVAIATW